MASRVAGKETELRPADKELGTRPPDKAADVMGKEWETGKPETQRRAQGARQTGEAALAVSAPMKRKALAARGAAARPYDVLSGDAFDGSGDHAIVDEAVQIVKAPAVDALVDGLFGNSLTEIGLDAGRAEAHERE